MARVIVLLSVFLAFPASAFAQFFDDGNKEIDHPDKFQYHLLKDKAADAFKNKEYQIALQFYVRAIQHMEAYQSKEYFPYEDVGDAYLKLERPQSAAWAYARALKVLAKFQQNDEKAKSRLEEKLQKSGDPQTPSEFKLLGWPDEPAPPVPVKEAPPAPQETNAKDIPKPEEKKGEKPVEKPAGDNKPQPAPEKDAPPPAPTPAPQPKPDAPQIPEKAQ